MSIIAAPKGLDLKLLRAYQEVLSLKIILTSDNFTCVNIEKIHKIQSQVAVHVGVDKELIKGLLQPRRRGRERRGGRLGVLEGKKMRMI